MNWILRVSKANTSLSLQKRSRVNAARQWAHAAGQGSSFAGLRNAGAEFTTALPMLAVGLAISLKKT
jgi:hypothetical protein